MPMRPKPTTGREETEKAESVAKPATAALAAILVSAPEQARQHPLQQGSGADSRYRERPARLLLQHRFPWWSGPDSRTPRELAVRSLHIRQEGASETGTMAFAPNRVVGA